MARPIRKRASIERGVVGVVAEKGLQATTIQDIADAAQVSPGLLYRYWKNREDLAADVYCRHLNEVLGRLAEAGAAVQAGGAQGSAEGGAEGGAATTDTWPRLCAVVRALLEYADEQPTVVRFLLFAQHELADYIPPREGVRAFLRGVVEAGMADGTFRRMDVELAMALTIGVVIWPIVGAMYEQVSRPLAGHAEEIIGALGRVLMGERPAGRQATA